MRKSNFALRLQPSLMEEARKTAESEGVALNQLINVAVAEKISALRTEEYFLQRAERANRPETLRILKIAGKNNPPIEGDELPKDWKKRKSKAKSKLGQTDSRTRSRRRKSLS
jgi:HicB family